MAKYDFADERLAKCPTPRIVTERDGKRSETWSPAFGECRKALVEQEPWLRLTSATTEIRGQENFVPKFPETQEMDLNNVPLPQPASKKRRAADTCQKVDKKCQVQLDFLNDADAAAEGLPPGTRAVMRACVATGKAGVPVPVASVADAIDKYLDFCTCSADQPEDKRRKCARHGGV